MAQKKYLSRALIIPLLKIFGFEISIIFLSSLNIDIDSRASVPPQCRLHLSTAPRSLLNHSQLNTSWLSYLTACYHRRGRLASIFPYVFTIIEVKTINGLQVKSFDTGLQVNGGGVVPHPKVLGI